MLKKLQETSNENEVDEYRGLYIALNYIQLTELNF